MKTLEEKIESTDWQAVKENLNNKGYALIPQFLPLEYCKDFISNYQDSTRYRKTIIMERYRFGLGEYKYFTYPLPAPIQLLRESIYPKLAPIANLWMEVLNIPKQFPERFEQFTRLCQEHNQKEPTVLILKYMKGGFNTLHQDLYGEVYFPIQLVFFLNEPDEEYSGGEFVLTKQIPRAQSQAIVLKPRKGDMLIFATNFLPVKGSKGYYRVVMKHGVSEVHSGERHTLGIIFHDATS